MSERVFNKRVRDLIVSNFETVCILIVILPTVVVVLAALMQGNLFGFLFAGLVFVVSAFLAGGALTLVSIAENTSETTRVLKQVDTELQSISANVERIETAWRDSRNEAAINATSTPPPL